MAFSKSDLVTQTVFGNLRIKIASITCDGTAGDVALGMGNIVAAHVSVKSMASDGTLPVVTINKGATGTSIVGTIALTATVSGDTFTCVSYHKS